MPLARRVSAVEMDDVWCGIPTLCDLSFATPQQVLPMDQLLRITAGQPSPNKQAKTKPLLHDTRSNTQTLPAPHLIGPSPTFIQLPPALPEVHERLDQFIVATLGMPHPAWRKKETIALTTIHQRCKTWLQYKNDNTKVVVKDLEGRLQQCFPKVIKSGPRRARYFELRWVAEKSTFPTLFQIVILYLLRDEKAAWNAFWTSPFVWQLDPSSLQHILAFGQSQCPEIVNSNHMLLQVMQSILPPYSPDGPSKSNYVRRK